MSDALAPAPGLTLLPPTAVPPPGGFDWTIQPNFNHWVREYNASSRTSMYGMKVEIYYDYDILVPLPLASWSRAL